ncbi:MAG TPA: CoA transferase [Caulobacteraceae bacterium]|nr:CoA transferase [Caulobacteraceae bacterium]
MSPIGLTLAAQAAQIRRLTGDLGRPVDVASLGVLERRGLLPLQAPGVISPNRACRMFRCADDWMALNLARDDDRDLVAAWLQCEVAEDPWATIQRAAKTRPAADLLEGAVLLGLPAGRVGEITLPNPTTPLTLGTPKRWRDAGRPRVVDLSALWAGPMCGAILAEAGFEVTKVESTRRPDPTREGTPVFFQRLNGRKRDLPLDLGAPDGQARLRELIEGADVLITSARPRAFVSLGLSPEDIFRANPALTWVAITGYGWSGEAASRVAFGDDAAAAGGLVRWTKTGAPRFLGDALADPVTGIAAALGALRSYAAGGGVLVDVSLARSAAGAAADRKAHTP